MSYFNFTHDSVVYQEVSTSNFELFSDDDCAGGESVEANAITICGILG